MTFSEEISTSGAIAQGGVASVFIAFYHNSLQIMVPYVIVVFAVVVLDLIQGIKASIKRGEEIRVSRAIRRTVSKLFEYICWVVLATTLSLAVNWSALQYIILCIPLITEMISIVDNYLFSKGKKITGLNFWKIFGSKLGVDLDDVKIEDRKDEDK